jgi:type I restriction enzyme S subunit
MREPLKNLADVYYGKSPSEVMVDESDTPVLGTGGAYGLASRALFHGPAIVVPRKGSLGNPQFVSGPFWAADTTYAVLPRPGIDGRWLYYNLDAFDLTKLNEATGVPSISRDWLYRIKFETPPSIEQRRIAEILLTMDEAIKHTEALIAKYGQTITGLMKDLFTRGVTTAGKLRPLRAQGSNLYKKSPLGWIPKEWELKPLREVAGYQHGRPFPSTDYSVEGAVLVRPGNLHVSGFVRFDKTHTTRIPYKWLHEFPSYEVKPQDILMNLTAQSLEDQFLGRVCIVPEVEPSLLNQRIARFSPRQVDRLFLYWLLRSVQFRSQIDRTSQGTKVQHIYNSDLNKIVFGVPSNFKEQVQIASILMTATRLLLAYEANVEKLRQQRQGLMQDLLTGRVRVKQTRSNHQASTKER